MTRILLVLVTAAAVSLSVSAGPSPPAAAAARGTSVPACVDSAIHSSLRRASSRYVTPSRWTITARVRAVKAGCGGRRTVAAYPEVNFKRAASKRAISGRVVNGATKIFKRYKLTRNVCKRGENYVRGVVELTYVLNGRSYGYRRYVATRNKPCSR